MLNKPILAALAGMLAIATSTSSAAAAQQPGKPELELWRLDCGNFEMKRFGDWFSDTFQYPPGMRPLVGSCYLIRHGTRYLLWDTGLGDELIDKPVDNDQQRMWLKRSLLDQLKEIGVAPDKVGFVGISHYHDDHIGQAKHFPNATLVIGQADWTAIKDEERRKDARALLEPWISGKSKVVPVAGDIDIFRDGSVTMLALPGHTPGHSALLVRLASGPVLLSGDQYHFTEAVKNRGVPAFNSNRADTLASHDRFQSIAANTKARVIIQHEPADVAKLPAFPASAR